jgi:hypothetical protein
MQAVVVASCNGRSELRVYSISRGDRLAATPAEHVLYVAADPRTATVFASVSEGVRTWEWDGTLLRASTAKCDIGSSVALAVMPPTSSARCSYLIAVPRSKNDLKVGALLCPAHPKSMSAPCYNSSPVLALL